MDTLASRRPCAPGRRRGARHWRQARPNHQVSRFKIHCCACPATVSRSRRTTANRGLWQRHAGRRGRTESNKRRPSPRDLEGSLTGSLYSATDGSDDEVYDRIAPILRRRVGRLLNDKMPTGVAVSPAMNHGGPFPATGHPGFTAVGIPASLRRFAMLECYDNVRSHRLPAWLQDASPNAAMWRSIDGKWTQDAVKSV